MHKCQTVAHYMVIQVIDFSVTIYTQIHHGIVVEILSAFFGKTWPNSVYYISDCGDMIRLHRVHLDTCQDALWFVLVQLHIILLDGRDNFVWFRKICTALAHGEINTINKKRS